MSHRRDALARLHEELRNIEILNRIDDATEEDPVRERTYALRQLRGKQVQDDIARLEVSKSELAKSSWINRAVVGACAFSYAMLYFLLR